MVERERAANLEHSVELLRTIAGVLDIRRVFPRVSEIVGRVLPHDNLSLSFHDLDGPIVLEARSNDAYPAFARLLHTLPREQEVVIVRDFSTERTFVTDPPDFQDRIVAAGFRSALGLHAFAREQACGWGSTRSVPTRFLRTMSLSPVGYRITSPWPFRTNNWPRPSVAWRKHMPARNASRRAFSRSRKSSMSNPGWVARSETPPSGWTS